MTDRELSMAPKYFEDYQAGVLHIKDLAVTDDASYECRAINRVGFDSKQMLLRVYGVSIRPGGPGPFDFLVPL